MKKIHYFCNLCREEIKDDQGVLVYYTGMERLELLSIQTDKSDVHICFLCTVALEKQLSPKST